MSAVNSLNLAQFIENKPYGAQVSILHDTDRRISAIFEEAVEHPIEQGSMGLRFRVGELSVSYFDGYNGNYGAIQEITILSPNTESRIDIPELRKRVSRN